MIPPTHLPDTCPSPHVTFLIQTVSLVSLMYKLLVTTGPLSLSLSLSYIVKMERDFEWKYATVAGAGGEDYGLPPLPPSFSSLYPYDRDNYYTAADDGSLCSLIPFPLASASAAASYHKPTLFSSPFTQKYYHHQPLLPPLSSTTTTTNNDNTYTKMLKAFYDASNTAPAPEPFDFLTQNDAPYCISPGFNHEYCCSSSLLTQQQQQQQQQQPSTMTTTTFDFFSSSTSATTATNNNHLPGLRALESPSLPVTSRSSKRPRFTFNNENNRAGIETTRRRRQKISEKTNCLKKLMPWDKKMDMATTLGEAYKYVKFLQAQVRVLQSMPLHNHFSGAGAGNDREVVFGEEANTAPVGMLSRQRLLQVVLSSSAAQSWLYSNERCVCSVEQVVALKKCVDRRAALGRILAFGGGCDTGNC